MLVGQDTLVVRLMMVIFAILGWLCGCYSTMFLVLLNLRLRLVIFCCFCNGSIFVDCWVLFKMFGSHRQVPLVYVDCCLLQSCLVRCWLLWSKQVQLVWGLLEVLSRWHLPRFFFSLPLFMPMIPQQQLQAYKLSSEALSAGQIIRNMVFFMFVEVLWKSKSTRGDNMWNQLFKQHHSLPELHRKSYT